MKEVLDSEDRHRDRDEARPAAIRAFAGWTPRADIASPARIHPAPPNDVSRKTIVLTILL
jgi:hypothetical protein